MKTEVVAILLVTAVLATGCGRKAEQAYEEIRPVRSAVVGASNGSVAANYSGEIHAHYETRLGFRTSGKITARLVEIGAHVKRGQSLMRLDPADETLHVVAAVASVDAAKSRVAQNRVDLERTEQLFAKNFASRAELDQQRLLLEESEAQLKSALAQRQLKVNQRGYTELLADRDGIVSAINAEAGQVVAPGQQVLTLAGDGEREVLVSIPEQRVEELRQARNLRISLWANPGRVYQGELRELAPDTDSITRTYAARVTVTNADDAVRLGMTATVFAPDVAGASAIRLPLTAIYDKDGQPLVWVIDSKTSLVTTRAVKLAAVQNDSVLIATGLVDGETVVTAGVHMLHPGQRVRIVAAPSYTREAKS